MIRFVQDKIIGKMNFNDYLNCPHFSNSGFSEYNFQETEKTRFGKLVDQYISGERLIATTDKEKEAFSVAKFIENTFKELFSISKKQVSIFGKIEYDIFSLPFKTRPDFFVPEITTIDLKITWERLKNVESLIEHMQYGRQCYFHRKMANTPESALLFYSIPDRRTLYIRSNEDWDDFLIEKIMTHGNT